MLSSKKKYRNVEFGLNLLSKRTLMGFIYKLKTDICLCEKAFSYRRKYLSNILIFKTMNL